MTALPMLLVVDDDIAIRDALADVLSDEGYSVVTRRDGSEALDYLKAGHRPSAIILDLWMPQMDGWVLRRELLADPALESIPVLVLTAAADRAAPPVRVAGVLHKPVALQVLLALLERTLGAT
ncbi:MAG: response regulator [Myxococcales bacterium]|nr:response regulator [Myxococcales bacterium]